MRAAFCLFFFWLKHFNNVFCQMFIYFSMPWNWLSDFRFCILIPIVFTTMPD